jgi:hypothetical protein
MHIKTIGNGEKREIKIKKNTKKIQHKKLCTKMLKYINKGKKNTTRAEYILKTD